MLRCYLREEPAHTEALDALLQRFMSANVSEELLLNQKSGFFLLRQLQSSDWQDVTRATVGHVGETCSHRLLNHDTQIRSTCEQEGHLLSFR